MLVMYVVVSVCVGSCGNTWGAVTADHGVTVCEDLIESPGWLVVCCSWGAVHHSWVSPRGPPDSGVPLGQLKLS